MRFDAGRKRLKRLAYDIDPSTLDNQPYDAARCNPLLGDRGRMRKYVTASSSIVQMAGMIPDCGRARRRERGPSHWLGPSVMDARLSFRRWFRGYFRPAAAAGGLGLVQQLPSPARPTSWHFSSAASPSLLHRRTAAGAGVVVPPAAVLASAAARHASSPLRASSLHSKAFCSAAMLHWIVSTA